MFNRRTDKEIVVYWYKGILLSNKKEWITGTCDNVDELKNVALSKKKPDTKDRTLYDSIHMAF